MNNAAIDQGVSQIVKIDIPAAWADATDAPEAQKDVPEFITKLQKPINARKGTACLSARSSVWKTAPSAGNGPPMKNVA